MRYFKHLAIALVFCLSITIAHAELDWNDFKVFSGNTVPYASNGPGCRTFESAAGAMSIGQNCPNGSNPVYDLGAVWVDKADGFIAWKFVGPDLTDAEFCGGTKGNSGVGLRFSVEFDADANSSTGCQGTQGYPCYPGSEHRLTLFGDNSTQFQSFNSTLLNVTCHQNNESSVCFSTQSGSLYDVHLNITCGPPSTILIAINESAINPVGMRFNANSFTADGPPVDMLGGFSEGEFAALIQHGGDLDYMFEQEHPCVRYDSTNETACVNNTNNLTGADSCVWDSFASICDPDYTSLGCDAFCGACTSTANCQSGGKGKCKVVDAPPILPSTAISFNDGGTKICVEDFTKVQVNRDNKCDSDCKSCFTNETCANSAYPNPTGTGSGCSWVTDDYFQTSRCELNTFDTSVFDCAAAQLNRCFNQTACTAVSGNWSSALNVCYNADSATEALCFDAVDNDDDGFIDCFDEDCAKDPFCGANVPVLTGAYGTLDPLQALRKELFEGAEAGPPVFLGDDADDSYPDHLDIQGLGFKDMGKGLGMGLKLESMQNTTLCGGLDTGTYYYYLDIDADLTTGCTVTLSNSSYDGFEFKFVYDLQRNATNGSLEVRQAFRCIDDNTTFALFPAKIIPAPSEEGFNIACLEDVAIVAVDKRDIDNPNANLRFLAATSDNVTEGMSEPNDTITGDNDDGIYYTTGSIDFKPKDCFENPLSCGTAFGIIGGGKYMPFEECFPSTGDEDLDGLTNCADPDCLLAPWCAGQYNVSADKTAPTVFSTKVEAFNDFVFMHWITDEPSNATVTFQSTCFNTTPMNIFHELGAEDFSFDDYRPWHDLSLENGDLDSLNQSLTLSANTTYFYKLTACDQGNNCATSACLNFTTRATAQSVQYQFAFEETTDPLVNGTQITLWNGTAYENITAGQTANKSNYLKDGRLKFANADADWEIELFGVDLAKGVNFNVSSTFNITNQTNTTFVGMDNQKWTEFAQSLGVEYILLTIPGNGTDLHKCNEGNITDCNNVTAQATLNESAENYTKWKVPVSLGFSVYGHAPGAGGGGGGGGGSSSSSSSSGGGGGGGSGSRAQYCSSGVWSCGDWSKCSNNKQTRTCTKTKKICSESKPATVQSCTSKPSFFSRFTGKDEDSSTVEVLEEGNPTGAGAADSGVQEGSASRGNNGLIPDVGIVPAKTNLKTLLFALLLIGMLGFFFYRGKKGGGSKPKQKKRKLSRNEEIWGH